MKTFALLLFASLLTFTGHAQPMVLNTINSQASSKVATNDLVNYRIHVEWKDAQGHAKTLEVLTAPGQFSLDTIETNSMQINDAAIPTTLKFSGTLTTLNDTKGRLQLFLGRTVPYVTGTYNGGSNRTSSYSQLSVGLDSTIIVTFGKSAVIQTDENGQVSILVQRLKE